MAKLDEIYSKYTLVKDSFAVPLEFHRFYLTILAQQLGEKASKLKALYSSVEVIDFDLYSEVVELILTISSYISHLERYMDKEDYVIYNNVLSSIYNNETVNPDLLFLVKEIIIRLLVKKGLLDVFQLSRGETFVDELVEEEPEEVKS